MNKMILAVIIMIIGGILHSIWVIMFGIYILLTFGFEIVFENTIVNSCRLGKRREARERARTYTIACSLVLTGVIYLIAR